MTTVERVALAPNAVTRMESIHRTVSLFPDMPTDFATEGGWWGHCRACRKNVRVPAEIGHRVVDCCGTEQVVGPPRSYGYAFRRHCRSCDPDYTDYGAIDLRPSNDGTKVVASYRCDAGHEWVDEWNEPPGGRPLTFRKLRTALYRHFDRDRVLLYVGVSMRPVARGKQHAGSADWTEFAAFVEGIWYPTRAEAQAVELRAIRTERPVFNRQHADADQPARETEYLATHTTPGADRTEHLT